MGEMTKLTDKQKLLINDAFLPINEHLDTYGCIPKIIELDGYTFDECSTQTLKSLVKKGFVEAFVKHQTAFSITWNAGKVYDWITL